MSLDDLFYDYKEKADAAFAIRDFARAEACWAVAAVIAQSFGDGDRRLSKSLDHLAHALLKQQKYSLAEALLSRAWSLKTGAMSNEPIELANTLNIVAELFFLQGKLSESEQLCQRVHSMYYQAYGPDHNCTLVAADTLAVVTQMRQRREAEAQSLQPAPVVSPVPESRPGGAGQAPPEAPVTAQPAVHASQPASTETAAAVEPQPVAASVSRRSSMAHISSFTKCEVCGFDMDGESCQRCTGTSVKIISPYDRLT